MPGSYRTAVVLDHGGGMAPSMPTSRLAVIVGQQVNAGDVIGFVGATGSGPTSTSRGASAATR